MFGGWAVADNVAMICTMTCGSPGKNELGMTERIARMGIVHAFVHSCVWFMVGCLALAGAERAAAADENSRIIRRIRRWAKSCSGGTL
jgi:hypothetical protein